MCIVKLLGLFAGGGCVFMSRVMRSVCELGAGKLNF